MDEYRAWYKDQTHKRLQENSWGFPGLPGKYIDIVNDVINTTSMHWAADNLVGPLIYLIDVHLAERIL